MCVTITPAAAQFMRRIMRLSNADSNAGFRLTVTPGGCSGLHAYFHVEPAQPGDTVFVWEDIPLILPEASCALLRGCTIDFTDSSFAGGFQFHHVAQPNHTCGCGSQRGIVRPPTQTGKFRVGGVCHAQRSNETGDRPT